MGKASIKKYPTDEIIESVLKEENTSKKNNNAYRNKNKNTANLVSSIFFYHRKDSLLLFSVANEHFLEARAFLNNAIPLGIHLREKIFLTFGSLTIIKYKNFCESK